MNIDIKKELSKLFKEHFWEDWMNEEDFSNIMKIVFEKTNTSYDFLHDQILEGIEKGYSIESQLTGIRKILLLVRINAKCDLQ